MRKGTKREEREKERRRERKKGRSRNKVMTERRNTE